MMTFSRSLGSYNKVENHFQQAVMDFRAFFVVGVRAVFSKHVRSLKDAIRR